MHARSHIIIININYNDNNNDSLVYKADGCVVFVCVIVLSIWDHT